VPDTASAGLNDAVPALRRVTLDSLNGPPQYGPVV